MTCYLVSRQIEERRRQNNLLFTTVTIVSRSSIILFLFFALFISRRLSFCLWRKGRTCMTSHVFVFWEIEKNTQHLVRICCCLTDDFLSSHWQFKFCYKMGKLLNRFCKCCPDEHTVIIKLEFAKKKTRFLKVLHRFSWNCRKHKLFMWLAVFNCSKMKKSNVNYPSIWALIRISLLTSFLNFRCSSSRQSSCVLQFHCVWFRFSGIRFNSVTHS